MRSPPPPPWPGPSTSCSWPGLCWSPAPSTHSRQSESQRPGGKGMGLCPACRSPPPPFSDILSRLHPLDHFLSRFTRFMGHPRGARPGKIQSESVPRLENSSPGFDSVRVCWMPASGLPFVRLSFLIFIRERGCFPDPFQCWCRPLLQELWARGGGSSCTVHASCSRCHAGRVDP